MMKFKRNLETGILEVFDNKGNKIGEIVTMGDNIKNSNYKWNLYRKMRFKGSDRLAKAF